MTKTNTFFYILIVIIALLLLSLPYAVRATNDIATAIQSNGTLVELTAIWAELQNVSLATGIGNTTVSITVNIATNYSTATAYGRIKRDNVVLETFNLSKSYYAETVTFIAPVTETEGTHIYTFEAYCTAGRRCQIYNRTFSVQYLNATVNINVSNATGTLSPDRLANNQKWFNANFMFGNGTGVATGIMNTYEIPKNGTANFVRITTVNTTSNKGNLTGHILKKTCSLNQATTADSIGQFWINASNYSYSTLLSGVAISRGDCINDYITSSDNITRGTITIDFLES